MKLYMNFKLIVLFAIIVFSSLTSARNATRDDVVEYNWWGSVTLISGQVIVIHAATQAACEAQLAEANHTCATLRHCTYGTR